MTLKNLFLSSLLATLCAVSANAQDPEPLWENTSFDRPPTSVSGPETGPVQQPQIGMATLGLNSQFSTATAGQTIGGAPPISSEIRALADNLGNDPVRIFNYVRNEIDYEHYEGLRKGAELTLLEGSGNDFDQCALLADLLCAQTGYVDNRITFNYRPQKIDYDYLKDWMGLAETPYPGETYFEHFNKTITSDFPNGIDKGVKDLVAKQSLFASNFLRARGSQNVKNSTDGFPQKATLVFNRCFLTVMIGGISYDLDPSYKTYEKIDGLNLLEAAGYSRDKLISLAGGGANKNYALSLDEGKIDAYLTRLNGRLLDEISTNHPGLSMSELVGGRRILKRDITNLNDAFFLPKIFDGNGQKYWRLQYQIVDQPVPIPSSMQGSVRFQVGSHLPYNILDSPPWFDISLNTAELNGRKISLTFNDGVVELRLDDEAPIATARVNPTRFWSYYPLPGLTYSDTFNMTMTVTLPGLGPMTETKTYKIGDNNAYSIIYGFSPSGKLLQRRHEKLAAYLKKGMSDSSREVRTELLNIMGLTWLYQVELATKILASQNHVLALTHHRFGRMAQEQGFYVDVGLSRQGVQTDDGSRKGGRLDNVFHLGALFASAMEHGIIEQMQPGSSAVSTVNILRKANADGQRLYRATGGNWDVVKSQLPSSKAGSPQESSKYSAAQISVFDNYINAKGGQIFLPQKPDIVQDKWKGAGWVVRVPEMPGSPAIAGMIISGDYKKLGGGYSSNFGEVSSPSIWSDAFSNPSYKEPSYTTGPAYVPPSYSTPSFFGSDPVNMATGAFEYSHTDMETGIEPAPCGLSFSRSYSSSSNKQDSQNLGYGWTHSLHIRAAVRTAVEESLGLGSVQQAASFITATLVGADLYREKNVSVQEWGTAVMTVGWFVDGMKENAVAVTIGSNSFQFVRQPDGEWQAPAGSTMKLLIDSDKNIHVSQRNGNTMDFEPIQNPDDKSQRIKKIVDPDGKQMTFNYLADSDKKAKNNDRIDYVKDAYGRKYTFAYDGIRISKITDSTGNRSVGFKYDSKGNLERATDPEGKFNYFEYEVPGDTTVLGDHRIVRTLNHDNQVITQNVYDKLGRVRKQYLHGDTDKSWKLGYAGSTSTEEDPNGGITTYYYDERGRSTGKRDPNGNMESWIYDGQDQIVSKTSGAGETTTCEYDSHYNLTWIHHPRGGGSTHMAYDSRDRLVRSTDPDGQTDYIYNPENHTVRPDQIKDPVGTTTYLYVPVDADHPNVNTGKISKITDQDNFVTEYMYDSNGNLDWVKVGGFRTDFSFSARGDLKDSTDPNGIKTAYVYNDRRQVTKVTADDGGADVAVQEFAYNNQGLLKTTTDAPDNNDQRFVTRQWYSPTEKPTFTRTTDEDGQGANDPVTEVRYDNRDWQSQIYDSGSRLTSFTPQANGQLYMTTLPLGRVKTQLLDGDGRPVASTAPGSAGTRSGGMVYNLSTTGFPQTVITTPDSNTVSEIQDRSGRPRFYKNRKGDVWEFRYDGLGRRTHVISPLDAAAQTPRAQVTEYFHRGAVKKITEPSGQATIFSYGTASGRLATVDDPVGTISHTLYDNNGNLKTTSEQRKGTSGSLVGSPRTTNRTYDRRNRLLSRTDENGQTIGYRYYPSGKLANIIYPGGSETGTGHVEYTWWKSGRLKQVIDKLDSITAPRTTTYDWNIDGRLRRVTRPNKTVREIKYDAAGRPEVVEEYGPGATPTAELKLIFTHKHGYYPSDEMQWRYELPKSVSTTAPPAMKAMTYNADNQLATWNSLNVIHDADGNMTSGPSPLTDTVVPYTYDARNRLTSALDTTYSYDSDSQRIGMVKSGVTTTYAVDVGSALSKVLVRTKGGVSTRYVWGLGLIYEVNGSGSAATTTTYHHDATGSTLALTNDAAQVVERISYTPFGQIQGRTKGDGTALATAPLDTPFLFTGFFGNQTDDNGLLYMRARYYHPRLGRFLNADPAQDGKNWYGYAGGNPIGFVDPMGLGIEGALDAVQTTLGLLGMIPVYGAVFDMANSAISIGRGNYVDAAIYAFAAIPGIGDEVGAAKLAGGEMKSGESLASLCGAGCFVAGTEIATADGLEPIEVLHVGDRVLTTSTISSSTEVDRATWHKISLTLADPEHSSGGLKMEMLRSDRWIAEAGCRSAAKIWLDIHEMGLSGWADVERIDPCPEIQVGSGRVVLATMTRDSAPVLEVTFRGGGASLHPTPYHPLYSITGADWTPASKLRSGEVLRTRTGQQTVETVSWLSGEQRVFNLEVETDHCYFVGGQEILSHNACGAAEGSVAKTWSNLIPETRPPGTLLKDPSSLVNSKFSGSADFVVTASGDLRVGQSHAYLSDGGDVLSAGRATFRDGSLMRLDNWSGHYKPFGVDPAIPEGAFNANGFNASGLYRETLRPK